jgi:protein-tyrosine phosphatase
MLLAVIKPSKGRSSADVPTVPPVRHISSTRVVAAGARPRGGMSGHGSPCRGMTPASSRYKRSGRAYFAAVSASWDREAPGVLTLPSGRLVRGRALRCVMPSEPLPDLGLYLLASEPAPTPWPSRWLRWPDFGLPSDRAAAVEAVRWAWRSAEVGRVEVACTGGVGRTGTALACLAVLDGVPPRTAVAYVRAGYHQRAVEMPWQRRYVERFGAIPTDTRPENPRAAEP